MMRMPRVLVIPFVIALSLIPFGRTLAQGTLAQGTLAQGTRASVGPTIAKAAVGVHVDRGSAMTPAALPKRQEDRKNVAMMIVGGAALIVGAIIGDTPGTIIMVGGAGVGLYGLYKYLE